MLETSKLSFTYSKGNSFQFPDISLKKGEHTVIIGKSGSGKTTFLHLLAGILKADSGKVFINGTDIQRSGFTETDKFRGQNMGLIFQKHFFIGAITMMENLLLAQALPGLKSDKPYIESLLEELEIGNLNHKYPTELSQGELQRFSLARALANKPLLVLADEPTSSLDDENCNRFVTLLLNASERHNTTLAIATHDARLKVHFDKIIQL
jgi:ABC-type lipoprotein export system ATPase subunit